jgi:hypothetical protein
MVATGALLYLDRTWVKQERAKRPRRAASAGRFLATPWMSPNGAGVLGQVDF